MIRKIIKLYLVKLLKRRKRSISKKFSTLELDLNVSSFGLN
jgi:hypothetical protein